MTRGFRRAAVVIFFFTLASHAAADFSKPNRLLTRLSEGQSSGNVEKLSPEEGRRYLANLRARHPGVLERAAQVLRARGYADTGRVEVLRSIRFSPVELTLKGSKVIPLSDSYSGAEGEIVAWEWDDGNYDNWEGSVYLLEYSTGNWISVDMQTSLVENEEWNLVWQEPVAASDNYDDTPGGPDIQYASLGSFFRIAVRPQHRFQRTAIDWDRIRRKVEDWGWCTAFACAGTTIGCYTNPLVPPDPRTRAACSASTCLAVGVGCLYVLK